MSDGGKHKAEHYYWYGTARWKHKRKLQLLKEPLCAFCLQVNKLTPASVADHVVEHQGNPDSFWFGELQSLCVDCHDKTKRQFEKRGYYDNAIGVDGLPIDPKHPFYRANER